MAFKGFDRMKNAAASLGDKKKPVKVIKEGDMSPETKALPDETRPTPKGIGSSEKDMSPDPKKGALKGAELGGLKKYAPSKEVKKFDENYKKGGMVKSSASKRADGIAVKGKTKGKIC